jgi:prephenate dehydratase
MHLVSSVFTNAILNSLLYEPTRCLNSAHYSFRLGAMAFRDLNVTKMESRPSPRATSSLTTGSAVWEYVNYIDIEGGVNEEAVRNALKQLEECATVVRVLGSYPRFSGVHGQTVNASPLGG